ncbi:MAG: hypothetical protein U1F43_04385 [Myxococcota bacterium]
MRASSCALVFFALAVLGQGTAHALWSQNDNTGVWVDEYQDNLGIDFSAPAPQSSNVVVDAIGQAVKLVDPASPGTLVCDIFLR